jgi:DNA-binding transcriptional ArsR family regulator
MLQQSDRIDGMFHALADATRRGMVERLSRRAMSVSELAEPYQMSLTAVVQHLRLLERSGLVQSEKIGRVRICRVDLAALARAERWFTGRRAELERKFDRLAIHLAKERGNEGE